MWLDFVAMCPRPPGPATAGSQSLQQTHLCGPPAPCGATSGDLWHSWIQTPDQKWRQTGTVYTEFIHLSISAAMVEKFEHSAQHLCFRTSDRLWCLKQMKFEFSIELIKHGNLSIVYITTSVSNLGSCSSAEGSNVFCLCLTPVFVFCSVWKGNQVSEKSDCGGSCTWQKVLCISLLCRQLGGQDFQL